MGAPIGTGSPLCSSVGEGYSSACRTALALDAWRPQSGVESGCQRARIVATRPDSRRSLMVPCSWRVPASTITALSDTGRPAPDSVAVRNVRPTGCTPRSNRAPPPQCASTPSVGRHVGDGCVARADRWVSAPIPSTRTNSPSTTGAAARCSEYSTGRPTRSSASISRSASASVHARGASTTT